MPTLPTVAISLGDPAGIGAEVTARALEVARVRRALRPIVFGDDRVWTRACALAGVSDRLPRIALGEPLPSRGGALVCVSRLPLRALRYGVPSALGGAAQAAYIEAAIAAIQTGAAAALTTAPISKAAIHAAGYDFPGHTELLAARFRAKRVVMMLAGPSLRTVVATTHLRLRDVPRALTARALAEVISVTDSELRRRFGVRRPRLAVCGLNPHAGEAGLFGDEEAKVIEPAIRRCRAAGIEVTGPYPADGLFPRAAEGVFDAVVAMYHDQGLIPVKLLHFDEAVNVTLGLGAIRTSPDHGVAYDLAGKGRARPASMVAALLVAARLTQGSARTTG